MVTIFDTENDPNDALDEFDGQGHRSKFKVTKVRNRNFQSFLMFSEQIPNSAYGVTL